MFLKNKNIVKIWHDSRKKPPKNNKNNRNLRKNSKIKRSRANHISWLRKQYRAMGLEQNAAKRASVYTQNTA